MDKELTFFAWRETNECNIQIWYSD